MPELCSLERIEAVDETLLRLEQDLAVATPEFLATLPDHLDEVARRLALLLRDLRAHPLPADPRIRHSAAQLARRTARFKMIIQRGEFLCSTRLSNLNAKNGSYTATGRLQPFDLHGALSAEA